LAPSNGWTTDGLGRPGVSGDVAQPAHRLSLYTPLIMPLVVGDVADLVICHRQIPDTLPDAAQKQAEDVYRRPGGSVRRGAADSGLGAYIANSR
jgi:hypothetical protein